jgi:D-glycero-D-manno-heptose 1,7-bisphosphate phosphatase
MTDQIAKAGATIDAVYYCPHELEPPCLCRKPAPGLLLEAARAWDLDLSASWIIGDSSSDVQAGKNAGCRTAWLSGGKQPATESKSEAAMIRADVVASSLLDAVSQILHFRNSQKETRA